MLPESGHSRPAACRPPSAAGGQGSNVPRRLLSRNTTTSPKTSPWSSTTSSPSIPLQVTTCPRCPLKVRGLTRVCRIAVAGILQGTQTVVRGWPQVHLGGLPGFQVHGTGQGIPPITQQQPGAVASTRAQLPSVPCTSPTRTPDSTTKVERTCPARRYWSLDALYTSRRASFTGSTKASPTSIGRRSARPWRRSLVRVVRPSEVFRISFHLVPFGIVVQVALGEFLRAVDELDRDRPAAARATRTPALRCGRSPSRKWGAARTQPPCPLPVRPRTPPGPGCCGPQPPHGST